MPEANAIAQSATTAWRHAGTPKNPNQMPCVRPAARTANTGSTIPKRLSRQSRRGISQTSSNYFDGRFCAWVRLGLPGFDKAGSAHSQAIDARRPPDNPQDQARSCHHSRDGKRP